jgi:hypothetical protein
VRAQRSALLDLRSNGSISEDAFASLALELDHTLNGFENANTPSMNETPIIGDVSKADNIEANDTMDSP